MVGVPLAGVYGTKWPLCVNVPLNTYSFIPFQNQFLAPLQHKQMSPGLMVHLIINFYFIYTEYFSTSACTCGESNARVSSRSSRDF